MSSLPQKEKNFDADKNLQGNQDLPKKGPNIYTSAQLQGQVRKGWKALKITSWISCNDFYGIFRAPEKASNALYWESTAVIFDGKNVGILNIRYVHNNRDE